MYLNLPPGFMNDEKLCYGGEYSLKENDLLIMQDNIWDIIYLMILSIHSIQVIKTIYII